MAAQHVIEKLESSTGIETVYHDNSRMLFYELLYSVILNLALHFLLSYAAIDSVFGNARDYVGYVLASSIPFDLYHILYILKARKNLLAEPRSGFCRLYGLILLLPGISILSLFFDVDLIKIIALSTILRYAIDFYLGETSPFCLFSDKEVLLRDLIGLNPGSASGGEPSKSRYVRKMRAVTDYIFLRIPLPKIDPDILSALSVFTSLIFVLTLKHSPALAFILIIITLLLDWFDGLIAKQYGLCSEKGCLVDIISDRLSEGIMFIPFYTPWFHLFVLNNILVVLNLLRHKRRILPLRQLFLVYFLVSAQK